MRWDELKPGGRASASQLNALAAETERQSNFRVGAGAMSDGGTGVQIMPPTFRLGWWAMIDSIGATDGNGRTPHGWTEQRPVAGGTWEDKPNGKSGTTSLDPAYEVNSNIVSVGTIVWIDAGYVNVDPAVSQERLFEYCC